MRVLFGSSKKSHVSLLNNNTLNAGYVVSYITEIFPARFSKCSTNQLTRNKNNKKERRKKLISLLLNYQFKERLAVAKFAYIYIYIKNRAVLLYFNYVYKLITALTFVSIFNVTII